MSRHGSIPFFLPHMALPPRGVGRATVQKGRLNVPRCKTMTEKTFLGADTGGATAKSQGAPQICRHRGHYKFTAKRLVYFGLGRSDYVYFTVYSHHRKYTSAREDAFCIKSYGGVWETLGSLEENDLILVRPVGGE